jgi:hypothetical protein
MAMAGTCKQVRRAYTDNVWQALHCYSILPGSIANHIFSASTATATGGPSAYQEQVAKEINCPKIHLVSTLSVILDFV